MTDLLIKGGIAGLTLSLLIGPIFFAIIQTGVEKGTKAGLALCGGIWVSDLMIILLSYLGLSYILMLVQWDGFALWMGSIGGLILISFGVTALFNASKSVAATQNIKIKKTHYLQLAMKGLALNTVNPFTMIFWLGLMSTIIAQSARSVSQATVFFGALLTVMITFDVLKVLLSRQIRSWLNPQNVLYFRRAIGMILILFGFVLFLRVWIME